MIIWVSYNWKMGGKLASVLAYILILFKYSFAAVHGSESDMRFVYCAVVISRILNDWTFINVRKIIEFIESSLVSVTVVRMCRIFMNFLRRTKVPLARLLDMKLMADQRIVPLPHLSS